MSTTKATRTGPGTWAQPRGALRARHQRWALGVSAAAVSIYLVTTPGLGGQAAILAAAVAILGIPHGALDDLLASALLPTRLRRFTTFVLLYLLVSGFVVGLWLVAPVTSLLAFLAISTLHFGLGDAPQRGRGVERWVSVVARGSLPIVLPSLFHAESVAAAFSVLTRQPIAAANVQSVAAASIWPLALVWAAELALSARGLDTRGDEASRTAASRDITELGALSALFFLTEPLFAFAIYFGVWHSGRHIIELMQRLEPDDDRKGLRSFAAAATPLTVATLALLGAAFLALLFRDWSVDAALLSVLFIGLSALTVPHMVLTALNARGPLSDRGVTWLGRPADLPSSSQANPHRRKEH